MGVSKSNEAITLNISLRGKETENLARNETDLSSRKKILLPAWCQEVGTVHSKVTVYWDGKLGNKK